MPTILPMKGDEWLEMTPDDPARWQITSIMEAAVSVGVHPGVIRRWMQDGTLAPDTYEVHRNPHRLALSYRFDMRNLRRVATMSVADRKRLRGFVSNAGAKYVDVEALKDQGWEPGTKMVLSQNELALLTGISPSTVSYMLHTDYLYPGIDYRVVPSDTRYTIKEWDLDQASATIENWKVHHKGRRGAGGWKPRTTRRQRDIEAVKEFEQGYVPPSERPDPEASDWAIAIQERAEKQTALLLGNRRMSPRPYTVPIQNRRRRRPKKLQIPSPK